MYKNILLLAVTLFLISTPVFAQNEQKNIKEFSEVVKKNPLAIDYYNKGLEKYSLHTVKDYKEAIKLFDEAIKIVPNFAEALSMKAETMAHLSYRIKQSKKNDSSLLMEAEYFAQEALKINQNISQPYRALAVIYMYKDLKNESDIQAKKAINLFSNDSIAYYVLWSNSDKKTDSEYIKKALIFQPNNLLILNELGNSYSKERNSLKAKEIYQKIIKLSPNFSYAYNNIGSIYGDQDDFKEAIKYFRKAIEKDPTEMTAIENIRKIYKEQDDNKYIDSNEMIKIYNKALDLDSENSELYFYLGEVYYDIGKNDEAIKSFEKAFNLNNDEYDNSECVNNLIIAYYVEGKYEKIIDLLPNSYFKDEISFYKPSHSMFHIELGDSFYDEDKYDEAVLAYKTAIKLEPNNLGYHIKFAELYSNILDNMNDYYSETKKYSVENVIEEYNTALDLKPKNKYEIYIKLGEFYEDINEELALQNYQKAIDENKEEPYVYIKIGDSYNTKLGSLYNTKLALSYYQKAFELDKYDINTIMKIGAIHYKQGNLENTLKIYEAGLNIKHSNTEYHKKLGDIYEYLGRDKEAKKQYLLSKTAPFTDDLSNPENCFKLGNIYEKSENNFEQAIFYYKKAVNLKPSEKNYVYALSKIYKKLSEQAKEKAEILLYLKEYNLNKNNQKAIINLVNAYKKFNKYDEAISILKNSVNKNNSSDLFKLLADIYNEKAKLEEQIALRNVKLEPYRYIIELNSDNSREFYETAKNLRTQKRYEEAIVGLEEAIKMDPSNIYYKAELAHLYFFSLNKPNEAILLYKEIVKIDKNDSTTYDNLGFTYVAIKNYNDAIKAFEESLKINPNGSFAYYKLGTIYYELGKLDLSKENFTKSCKLNYQFACEKLK